MRGLGWKAWAIGFLNAALPVHAHRLGREVRRLRCRGDRERVRADLRGVILAFWFNPERARSRRPAGRAFSSVWQGSAVLTGLHPEGGWWAIAGTLAIVVSLALLRVREPLRAASTSRRRCAAASSRRRPPCVAAPSSCFPFAALCRCPRRLPSWKAIGVDRRPRRPRHGVRAAPLLPVADQLRSGAVLARHVPACRRSRSSTASLILDEEITLNAAPRPHPDPRGRRARVGRGSRASPARTRVEREPAPATPQG